jgi:hypothetical protein
MDAILTHIQERAMAYGAVAVCCLPLLSLFRRQVVPGLWYIGEIAIYLCLFHGVLHGVVRLVRWFKMESTFGALYNEKIDPGWQTPLLDFWDRALYKPSWLFYFEVIVAVFILYGVWRFRPFKVQKRAPRRVDGRRGLAGGVRPAATGSGVRK